MANTVFNTRLQLKYDTLANWQNANPKLLAGEIGVVSVPTTSETTVSQIIKPAILFKIGDGTTSFNDLPWASGLAADVYEWAKKENLEYEALPQELKNEINALKTLTAGELKMNDVTYSSLKEYVDAKTAGIATDAALGDLTTRVTGLENAIENFATKEEIEATVSDINATITGLAGRVATIEVDYLKAADKTALEQAIQEAVDAIPEYNDTEIKNLIAAKYTKPEAGIGTDDLSEDVIASLGKADTALQSSDLDELDGKVKTLVGEDANKSVRSISAEEVAKIVAGADESYDTLKEIADWISNHGTNAAEMNSAILALQAIVDGIGGENEDATVVAYINNVIAALNIDDYAKVADLTELNGKVTANEGAITAINDETTGILATAKDYTDEKVKAIKIEELNQTEDYVIFNCGSATEVM